MIKSLELHRPKCACDKSMNFATVSILLSNVERKTENHHIQRTSYYYLLKIEMFILSFSTFFLQQEMTSEYTASSVIVKD